MRTVEQQHESLSIVFDVNAWLCNPADTITRLNPLSAGDAFKRIHTVFPQLKFDRN